MMMFFNRMRMIQGVRLPLVPGWLRISQFFIEEYKSIQFPVETLTLILLTEN